MRCELVHYGRRVAGAAFRWMLRSNRLYFRMLCGCLHNGMYSRGRRFSYATFRRIRGELFRWTRICRRRIANTIWLRHFDVPKDLRHCTKSHVYVKETC